MATKTTDAQDQARAQIESIMEMVAALECDYERLEELREAREDHEDTEGDSGTDATRALWAAANPEDAAELAELETAAGECADADEARERIQEDALSVETRSGWVSNGEKMEAEEFRIVLCTGGPHVELVGYLDGGEPSRVRVLYKDWGTSGEYFPSADESAALDAYCACFYFGE